jgi:arsenite-transporting ATPase
MKQLAQRVESLRAALTDPQRSSYRLVLTPDRTVLREAQRAETYLNLFEYPLDAVLVNRLLAPSSAGDSYLDVLVARQQRTMNEIRAAFASLPLFEVPLTAEEPVGTAALERLAEIVYQDRDPTHVLHVGPTQRIERQGRGYLLRIPMPNVEIDRLALTKHGNELYVEVGTFRREVSLPLTLSALQPGVARMRAGMLEIPFNPAATGHAAAS